MENDVLCLGVGCCYRFLHTYPSNKSLFSMPLNCVEVALAKEEERARRVAFHLRSHLTVRCLVFPKTPVCSLCTL
jgi:hypothetical protein